MKRVKGPPKRSRLAEEELRDVKERMAALGFPGYLGTDSSGTWIEEQAIIDRAVARKKRAGQGGDPDRDRKMAKEFEERWPKDKGRLSQSALKEIIGCKYKLKRRAAINAIDRGLNQRAEWRLLPDGSFTDGTVTIFNPLRRRPSR